MKLTAEQATKHAGCWLDGHHGWHNHYRLVDLAVGHGMTLDEADHRILDAYRAGRDRVSLPSETVDVAAAVLDQGGFLDTAEQFLNDHVAPAGWAFGWSDGEFFLQPEEWWAEE